METKKVSEQLQAEIAEKIKNQLIDDEKFKQFRETAFGHLEVPYAAMRNILSGSRNSFTFHEIKAILDSGLSVDELFKAETEDEND